MNPTTQFLLLLSFCLRVTADPLNNWVQRSPLPSSEDIVAVTYVEGQFLASAGFGGILSSSDGVKWVNRALTLTNKPAASVSSIAFGSGLYIAVGANDVPVGFQGAILTSTDATEWKPQWSGVPLPLHSVAYGGGRFVAVGGNGIHRAIVTSDDGIHWTVQRLSDEGALSQVIFSQDRFYAVGELGAIVSSSDGIAWRQFTAPRTNQLSSIASGNGRLVVVGERGQFLSSIDGILWSTNGPALESGIPSVAFGGGQFVIIDINRVWVSTNGVDWASQGGMRVSAVEAVTYGGSQFVAVGGQGFVATSDSGYGWPVHSTGPSASFSAVAAGTGVVVGLADSTPLLTMGIGGWNPSGLDANYFPVGAGFANGQFIVFAHDNRNPDPVFVLTSSDGSIWARNDLTVSGAARRITYGNGQFVGVGGGILSSPDGRHWSAAANAPRNELSGVAYGNGRFVAVGAADLTPISTDGTNWTSFSSGTNFLTDVTFGKGQFVAIGNGMFVTPTVLRVSSWGEILSSNDGEHWSRQSTPFGPAAGVELRSITYGGGWFVIVGAGGLILTSSDGAHWTSRKSPTIETLASVAYADGVFVAAGSRGTTIFSGNLFAATLQAPTFSPAGFGFAANGEPGQVYHIQATADLLSPNWTEIGVVTNGSDRAIFLDPAGARDPARFYRAVKP